MKNQFKAIAEIDQAFAEATTPEEHLAILDQAWLKGVHVKIEIEGKTYSSQRVAWNFCIPYELGFLEVGLGAKLCKDAPTANERFVKVQEIKADIKEIVASHGGACVRLEAVSESEFNRVVNDDPESDDELNTEFAGFEILTCHFLDLESAEAADAEVEDAYAIFEVGGQQKR